MNTLRDLLAAMALLGADRATLHSPEGSGLLVMMTSNAALSELAAELLPVLQRMGDTPQRQGPVLTAGTELDRLFDVAREMGAAARGWTWAVSAEPKFLMVVVHGQTACEQVAAVCRGAGIPCGGDGAGWTVIHGVMIAGLTTGKPLSQPKTDEPTDQTGTRQHAER